MGCVKAKQACNYYISQGNLQGSRERVGPIRATEEESEEEQEGEREEEEEEEEEKPKTVSPVVKVFRKLATPLKSLRKRKTTELSPGTVKEYETEASHRAR